jgi:hypothetical protein
MPLARALWCKYLCAVFFILITGGRPGVGCPSRYMPWQGLSITFAFLLLPTRAPIIEAA